MTPPTTTEMVEYLYRRAVREDEARLLEIEMRGRPIISFYTLRPLPSGGRLQPGPNPNQPFPKGR